MVKFCTSLLSVSVILTKATWERKFIWVVESKYQQEGQDRNPETASEAERTEECCFSAFFLFVSYDWLGFLYHIAQPALMCLGIEMPSVGWVLLHRWSIKNTSQTLRQDKKICAFLPVRSLPWATLGLFSLLKSTMATLYCRCFLSV